MSESLRILVVDDERSLRDFIIRNLSARGYSVTGAANGLEALALVNTESYELIILDVMMPHMDGLETCRRIRQTSTMPIIILTALGEENDKVMALDLGADDYLTKPFGVEELLARVRAVLRRANWGESVAAPAVLRYRDLELNPAAGWASLRNTRLNLTRTEFDLLQMLMQNVGRVLPHRLILRQVWGAAYGNEAEYLRVYIGRLRRKIEDDPGQPNYIFTEYGTGYRFGV